MPLPLLNDELAQAMMVSWHESRTSAAYKPLNDESAGRHIQLFVNYVDWLAEEGLTVVSASPEDVKRFLVSREPRAVGSKTDKVSLVTERRYWRVLFDIYLHAVTTGKLERNPVREMTRPQREFVDALVLPFAWWEPLVAGIDRKPQGFYDTRDALALFLVCELALTATEVVNLKLAHVWLKGAKERPHALPPASTQESFALQSGMEWVFEIEGKRLAQSRKLQLKAAGSKIMSGWIRIRMSLGDTRDGDYLLRSRPTLAKMTTKTLYLLCAAHVQKTMTSLGKRNLPYHVGPNTLRNTRLIQWLRSGITEPEVCKRAGLKDTTMLFRLRTHLPY